MPFPDSQLHGQIQALPTHFTADIPRRQCGTRAYCLITDDIEYKGNVLHDSEMDWGFIYTSDYRVNLVYQPKKVQLRLTSMLKFLR